MNEWESSTAYVRQLLPSLRASLRRLPLGVGAESSSDDSQSPDVRYVDSLHRLQLILQKCDESAQLYLKYPTERLARIILEWIVDANLCIDAIAAALPAIADQRLCQDIRDGLREWRLCVLLPRLLNNLDESGAETLN